MAIIVGVDEVGRGSWAGPLVAGAVTLRKPVVGLKDSKKLSKAQRERLSSTIYKNAYVGLGWVTPLEVDELGLTEAVRLAMKRAVDEIKADYDKIIIDGNINYLVDTHPSEAMIKADDRVAAVSAASIVAKVARDEYMTEKSKLYPAYKFESNVGYGTAVHIQALKLNGPCILHRLSYKPLAALMV